MNPNLKNMSNDELAKYAYLSSDSTELEKELARRVESLMDELYAKKRWPTDD